MQQTSECSVLLSCYLFIVVITFALRKTQYIPRMFCNSFNGIFPIIFIFIESQLTILLATQIFLLNFQFNVFIFESLAFIFLLVLYNMYNIDIDETLLLLFPIFALFLFMFGMSGFIEFRAKHFLISAHIFLLQSTAT